MEGDLLQMRFINDLKPTPSHCMPAATRAQPKLLDDVRQVPRPRHYSIHTERSYVEGIVRFFRFHGMRSRADLFPAEKASRYLAVNGNVAAATPSQVMNALVLLYKRFLNHAPGGPDQFHVRRQENQRRRCDDKRSALVLA
jgi:hypothetical protein